MFDQEAVMTIARSRAVAAVAVAIGGLSSVAAVTAHAGAGLTPGEAATLAEAAANRYVVRHFGFSSGRRAWEGACVQVPGARRYHSTFRCSVVFNLGQCDGTLRIRESDLRAYRIRIGCGE
jgi:hypothetical protein